MFTLKRLLLACLAVTLGACAGADTSKKRTTPSDDDTAEEDDAAESSKKRKKRAADDDEEDAETADDDSEDDAPPKKKQKKRTAADDDDGGDEAEDDDGEGGVQEVRLSAKERERQDRRDRDREKMRKELEREEGKKRKSPFRERTSTRANDDEGDDDRDREDDADEDEDKPDPKKAAAAKKAAEAERKREEAEAKKEEAARRRAEEAERQREEAARRKAEAQAKKDEAAKKKAEDAARRRAEADAKKKQTAEAAAKKKKRPADDEEDIEIGDADEEDDDEEEDEEKVVAKPAPKKDVKAEKTAPKVATKTPTKPPPSDEVDEEEIDMTSDEPAKPSRKAAAETASDDDESDEEDRKPIDFDKLEQEDDPLARKRVAAIPVPGVDGEPSDDGPADAATPAFTPLTSRPLTLGKGRVEIHGGLRYAAITFPGTPMTAEMPATAAITNTSQGFLLGGTYGVSDKLEVGGDYLLSVNPGTLKGPLMFRGAYAVTSGKLDLAIAGGLALDFYEQANTVTMMTLSTTYASLQLGAWVRYHVTPKVSVFTGQPALPSSPIGISKLALPLPPFQYQLALGLSGDTPRSIELPVGMSFQATPSIFALAALNLAHISLTDAPTGLIFRDFIPLVLGGFYSMKKIDIGLVFSDDAKQGTDYLRFDAVLRYSLK